MPAVATLSFDSVRSGTIQNEKLTCRQAQHLIDEWNSFPWFPGTRAGDGQNDI